MKKVVAASWWTPGPRAVRQRLSTRKPRVAASSPPTQEPIVTRTTTLVSVPHPVGVVAIQRAVRSGTLCVLLPRQSRSAHGGHALHPPRLGLGMTGASVSQGSHGARVGTRQRRRSQLAGPTDVDLAHGLLHRGHGGGGDAELADAEPDQQRGGPFVA